MEAGWLKALLRPPLLYVWVVVALIVTSSWLYRLLAPKQGPAHMVRVRCDSCGWTGQVGRYNMRCSSCGSTTLTRLSGDAGR